MPKNTFLRLSPEKRAGIISAAMEEFALNNYEEASIASLAARAGIAKGSIYKYFENKEELYFYLIDQASQRKLVYIRGKVDLTSHDFFNIYADMIYYAYEFDIDFPAISKILYNAGRNKENIVVAKTVKKLMLEASNIFSDLLQRQDVQSSVRSGLDMDLISYLIGNVTLLLGEFLELRYKFSYNDCIRDGWQSLPISKQTIREEITKMIDFIRYGIAPRV